MLTRIELIEQEAKPVLSIRASASVEELPQLIGESYMKILEYMQELGIKPSDPPFTAYYGLDMEDLDVEMGFPISESFSGKGEITAGVIPAGKVVSTMHRGSYTGMEQPYEAMFEWMNDNGFEPTGVYYEYYLNTPDEVSTSELLTRIVMPVK